MDAVVDPLNSLIDWLSQQAPEDTFFFYGFNLRALLAIVMVSIICGTIGAQVVGNRMAFFSDALAHCAFAGFAIAFLIFLVCGVDISPRAADAQDRLVNWMMLIMVLFGVGIGLLIAFVHETTGLPSDTVIGVFFAGAIGLGAVFARMAKNPSINVESFIFGDPQRVRTVDLVYLFLLLVITLLFVGTLYNRLVLASVNPSLALSRNVPVRLCRYLFVMLLGLVVNLCLFVVGALLINALLLVPAAAAANSCRNLRQLFWCTVGISLACGLGGQLLSWELSVRSHLQLGTGGAIVMLTVAAFISSMLGRAWRDRASASARAA
jgi:zinc transport system permease protein